jgi:CTP synthase (UTP-ammonia lyase)
VLVEHARNLMGIPDASHAEYGVVGTPVVTLLACSLVESQIEIRITPASRLAAIHCGTTSVERTHCSYGLEPAFAHIAAGGGLVVSAVDDTGEVRAVERPDHPFFIATLYQPQRTSQPGAPHPIWSHFVQAALAA